MRPEEELARDQLIEFLRCSADSVIGEDPPDFYLTIDGEKHAVEVTRLTPVTFDENGNPGNRFSEDEQIVSIVRQIDLDCRDRVKPGHAYFAIVTGPLADPRAFRRELRAMIERVIEDDLIRPGWSKDLVVGGSKVHLAAFAPGEDDVSRRRIVWGVLNDNHRPFVEGNVRFILDERIREKHRIMADIPWSGSKWLALVNDTVIAEGPFIAEVFASMTIEHGFDRIFLIDRSGAVIEMAATT